MNPATTALALGFSVLLTNSGEPLKLLRVNGQQVSVAGLVDRTPDPKRYKGHLDFDGNQASVVMIFTAAVSPAPLAGEVFRDSNDVIHRITKIHPLNGVLQIFCNLSQA